jgi:hypothetical protein
MLNLEWRVPSHTRRDSAALMGALANRYHHALIAGTNAKSVRPWIRNLSLAERSNSGAAKDG